MNAKGALASLLLIGLAASVGLTGCDRKAHRNDRAGADSARSSDRSYDRDDRRGDSARQDAPKYSDGTPEWASNRRNSASEAAGRQFDRNGRDFGATSAQDYIAKVHAFVNHPPAGVETVVRDNGDKLFYDARSNTFAVVKRDGAPRTMFKPRDGASYWAEQKANLSGHGRYRNSRDKGDKGDRGGRRRDRDNDDTDNG